MEPTFKQKGGVLIEALISAAVLSVGILAITKMQTTMARSSIDSNQQNKAIILAQEKIEELRNFSTKAAYTNLSNSSDTLSSKDTTYTRTWSLTPNTDPNYKAVQVAVAWTTATNESKSVQLNSIIADHDPMDSARLFAISDFASKYEQNSSLAPNSATDQGDGTSDYTPLNAPNSTLTYDNSTGDLTLINDATAIKISGSITLGAGQDKPPTSFDLTQTVVVTSREGQSDSSYCTQSGSESLFTYECVVNNSWSGTISLSGISGVKVCTNTTQAYSDVVGTLTSQDYQVIDSSMSCSGSTPTLHQSL